ncbi:hypothetical protein ACTFIT_001631 [Dictyostelium discoideum]
MAEINIENPFHVNTKIDVNTFVNQIRGIPNGSRCDFTNSVVKHFSSLGYNVFVCHPNHAVTGPYAKLHCEFRNTKFSTIGYDVYIIARGRKVTATNFGDGGYDNWASGGHYNQADKMIKIINFLLILMMFLILCFNVNADIECSKIQCNVPKCPPGSKITHSRAFSCCPMCA